MRYLLATTRKLIAVATSVHLASLKGTVAVSQRKLVSHQTDAAKLARQRASEEAIRAQSAEQVASKAHTALLSAAIAEGKSLRRGFVIA